MYVCSFLCTYFNTRAYGVRVGWMQYARLSKPWLLVDIRITYIYIIYIVLMIVFAFVPYTSDRCFCAFIMSHLVRLSFVRVREERYEINRRRRATCVGASSGSEHTRNSFLIFSGEWNEPPLSWTSTSRFQVIVYRCCPVLRNLRAGRSSRRRYSNSW